MSPARPAPPRGAIVGRCDARLRTSYGTRRAVVEGKTVFFYRAPQVARAQSRLHRCVAGARGEAGREPRPDRAPDFQLRKAGVAARIRGAALRGPAAGGSARPPAGEGGSGARPPQGYRVRRSRREAERDSLPSGTPAGLAPPAASERKVAALRTADKGLRRTRGVASGSDVRGRPTASWYHPRASARHPRTFAGIRARSARHRPLEVSTRRLKLQPERPAQRPYSARAASAWQSPGATPAVRHAARQHSHSTSEPRRGARANGAILRRVAPAKQEPTPVKVNLSTEISAKSGAASTYRTRSARNKSDHIGPPSVGLDPSGRPRCATLYIYTIYIFSKEEEEEEGGRVLPER